MAWQSQYLNHQLNKKQVDQFIQSNDAAFDHKLSTHHNYSRVVSLAHFDSLTRTLDLKKQAHVGVVAGSDRELELRFLNPQKLTILNRESTGENYDLNIDWSSYKSQNFSMTICNQVLEHVANPHLAFKNLCHQTAPKGYLYVSIPSLNRIHGEPDFYSAGFHPRFLESLGLQNHLEILNIGYWGSYKYLINAVSGRWLAENRLKPGFFSSKDLKYPLQFLWQDGRENTAENHITDCWALFQKRS